MRSRLMIFPLLAGIALTQACTQQVTRAANGPVPASDSDRSSASAATMVPTGAPVEGMAAVAPMLSVERFLQAINARDFDAMGSLFGDHTGPIQMDPIDLELQMSILAEVLRHQDYRIVSERRTPGRLHPTNRIGVTLTIGGRVIPDVAFLVVQTAGGSWMVNEVDVEKVAGG